MSTLIELAERAESQPPRPGSGPYSYIHTRGWYLATGQTTDGRVMDARVEETDRQFWVAADGTGRIEETRDGRRSRMSGVYGPGELYPGPADAPGAVIRLQDVGSLWQVQTVSPALQAVLLRRLAAGPRLRLSETTDRAGRPGLAVSADDPPDRSEWRGRHVLVLDPETGMLLASQEIPLKAADHALTQENASSYTLWVRTGYAPHPDTRP
ncbi:MAG TPA: hypothetical protein VGN47_07370 [Blastococcus sp.]|jgi:hypothetical protein|nr:hypothetical protein [Blastococcus sp.]